LENSCFGKLLEYAIKYKGFYLRNWKWPSHYLQATIQAYQSLPSIFVLLNTMQLSSETFLSAGLNF